MFAETSVIDLEGQRVSESVIQDFKTRLSGRLLRPGMDATKILGKSGTATS